MERNGGNIGSSVSYIIILKHNLQDVNEFKDYVSKKLESVFIALSEMKDKTQSIDGILEDLTGYENIINS